MREFFTVSVSRCAELQREGSLGTVAEAKAWLDDDGNIVDVLLTDLGLPISNSTSVGGQRPYGADPYKYLYVKRSRHCQKDAVCVAPRRGLLPWHG